MYFTWLTVISVNGTQHNKKMSSAPTTVSATEIIERLYCHYQKEINYLVSVSKHGEIIGLSGLHKTVQLFY